ncbi:hypothetical protein GA0061094_3308 [[Bacillus] enclensis]|uniref:Uncharacterized protein n=1 Tax=[Bacillus] enclensis TaxID=1402860 RepID=A0A1C4CW37_9BACI|nr:hypothetical protein GA0061094_3308 [[Bacillus] enclensis]
MGTGTLSRFLVPHGKHGNRGAECASHKNRWIDLILTVNVLEYNR